MGCLSVKVDVHPGVMIAEAAKEAQDLADKLNVSIEFQFNEVHCCVFPGGCHSNVVRAYYDMVGGNKKHKLAFS